MRIKQQEAVPKKGNCLSWMDPHTLPDQSRYLLEIDFSSFSLQPLPQHQYWIYTMKAAMKAGKRVTMCARVETARAQCVIRVGVECRHCLWRVTGALDEWDVVKEEHRLQEHPS